MLKVFWNDSAQISTSRDSGKLYTDSEPSASSNLYSYMPFFIIIRLF